MARKMNRMERPEKNSLRAKMSRNKMARKMSRMERSEKTITRENAVETIRRVK